MSTKNFIVRAALSEDSNSGWAWIQAPTDPPFDTCLRPRTIIKIVRPIIDGFVYVELRKIDDNFRKRYNAGKKRFEIPRNADTLVISQWYRDALGITDTTRKDYESCTIGLRIRVCTLPVWPHVRAACHHPDIAVRVGTRLGLCGIWLGFLGACLGLTGGGMLASIPCGNEIAFLVVLLSGLGAIVAMQGPRSPKKVA